MRRILCALVVVMCGCGDRGSEAIRRGVGAECNATNACTEDGQVCLTEIKGGYCGVSGCVHDSDCPQGSACVTDDGQINYCFLICAEQAGVQSASERRQRVQLHVELDVHRRRDEPQGVSAPELGHVTSATNRD